MAFNNIVIDVSHHNGNPGFTAAGVAGVVGMIHKATNGSTGKDPMYATNTQLALASGLLCGAYHFGTGEDGVTQAAAFLDVVQPTAQTIVALDFEENPTGPNMTLEDARDFITHVYQATGIYPGIYGGGYLKTVLAGTVDPTLTQCWLWLAQYGPTAVVPPCWSSWTLWQYSDGSLGPSPTAIPGIGHCDRSAYCGDADDLAAKWATGSLA